MNESEAIVLEATLDELWLDMDEVCRMACVEVTWVQARLDCGALTAHPAETDQSGESGRGGKDHSSQAWRFNHISLCRIRRIACLERDFDAVPELAALVVDLEDEVRHLRERLKCLEG